MFLPEEPEQTKPILDQDHDYILISSQTSPSKMEAEAAENLHHESKP